MTDFINDFSKEIYEQTYKYGDENINDTMLRIAKDLASCEENPEYWCDEFVKALENFKFVPGGRIISNAGLNLKGTTYINCYVSGFAGEDQDSMEGIMEALKRQALILKSEGGYGFCSDVMRPRGAFVHGIANDSPGSVKMLEMWDTQSDVITAGSGQKNNRKDSKKKIRKGAQMVTKSCLHPDIEEFITAKQTPGRLTKFNMSVLITDEFMDAVKNHKPWNLIFPDYDAHKEEYKKYWDGDFKGWEKRGLTFKVYKTYEDANELWDLIMQSTYCVDGDTIIPVYIENKYYHKKLSEVHNLVENGDDVFCISVNKNNLKLEKKKILKSFYNGKKDLLKIKTTSNEYNVTKEHVLFKGESGPITEIKAGEIKIGDNLLSVEINRMDDIDDIKDNDFLSKDTKYILNNSNVSYDKVRKITDGECKDVYDIKVEDNENFIDIFGGLYHNCRNEPGVLFVDTINKMNNLSYIEHINATNPCVVGDTLVFTNIGWIKIKNLDKYKDIKIITYDDKGVFYESELKWVGITNKMDDIYRVDFSNGEFMLVNNKHKFYKTDFSEVDILSLKEGDTIIGGNSIISIIGVNKLDYKEDVYDLTAVPNYNFFSILNRKEIVVKDDVVLNDNFNLKYFSVVNTDDGQKFAYELKEGDEII